MAFTLRIKFLDTTPDIVKEYYTNFKSHHEGDSGIDLITVSDVQVDGHQVGTLDFGIKTEMVFQHKNVSYYLYPRSSISKTPFSMANSVGIIDAGYRGNIMAKIRNMSSEQQCVHAGDKLFQICSPDLSPIKVRIVSDINETSRGDGGFGSTN
jgi:dUTP pyrophosphatase